MKACNKIFTYGICISLALIQMNCSKSHQDINKQEVELKKLSGTWKATAVTLDDVVESGYETTELTLSGVSTSSLFAYGVTGRPDLSPWPAGGTWKFTSSDSQIVRDPATADELVASYTVTDSQLVIKFVFAGSGYSAGKVSSVGGNWAFTFSKR